MQSTNQTTHGNNNLIMESHNTEQDLNDFLYDWS